MRPRFAFAFIALGLGLVSVAQGAETLSDIVAVRAAYAKLVMASRLRSLQETRKLRGADDVQISISDMQSGAIGELRDKLLSDVVSRPGGPVFLPTPGTWTIQLKEGMPLTTQMTAMPDWSARENCCDEEWSTPFSQLIDSKVIDPALTRYVSFGVHISYAGQKVAYKAAFFLGESTDGKPLIFTFDPIGNLPDQLIQAPVSMAPLSAQTFRGIPAVNTFLESLRPPKGCTVEAITGLCCDARGERCGIERSSLQVD